jgi:hypothetical protein
MNWSYVAGFFDGEGTIGMRTPSSRRPAYYEPSLCNTHKPTIDAISSFLEAESIRHRVFRRVHKNPKHNDCYYLTIRDVRATEQFLKQIIPHLITKTVRAKAALAWAKKTKGLTLRPHAEIEKAIQMYLSSPVSLRDIFKTTGIPQTTISHYAKRHGIKLRPQGHIPNAQLQPTQPSSQRP